MEEDPYIGTSVRGLTREIEIPVPWGIIAGKVYGESGNPPVLCIHGWLDNCNSFDTLIPLLPKDKFFVFVDMPGHGWSSNIPSGCFYTSYTYMAVLERISLYFSWPHFSIIGHSLGGISGGLYAGTFPEKVDKLILLESYGYSITFPKIGVERMRYSVENCVKVEGRVEKNSQTYSYKEVKRRLLRANLSLNDYSADVLLERGSIKQEDGTFKYTRDIRLKYRVANGLSLVSCNAVVNSVRAETLVILADHGIINEKPEKLKLGHKNLRENSYPFSDYFAGITYVKGKHHVHLCHPERVIGPIKAILKRPLRTGLPCPKPQLSFSKL